jgi:hypothetical protein
MTIRCVHELVIEWCAVCRPAPVPDPFEEPTSGGPWFTAAWAGTCSGCGDRFDSGDAIKATGGGEYIAECCGVA